MRSTWTCHKNAKLTNRLVSPQSLTRPAAVKRVFFIFFRLFESFFSTVEHTTALAQEHLFLLTDLFLFRVHPMRSAPYSFITSVLPTKHLFGPCGVAVGTPVA